MSSTPVKLALVAALIATGACSKKRPEQLPPPPAETAPVAPPSDPSTGTGVTPGSAEDFRQSVTSDTVNFALDSSDIDPQARAILDTQATWLQRYPNVRVTIEGHCDERGTREYNLALGDRRANAAKNYLASRGISSARINVISYGKERPLALGSDDDSYSQNRRAVTVVIG